MEYTRLDDGLRRAMMEQRLAQAEADHFAQVLARLVLASEPDPDSATVEAIQAIDKAMARLDKEHAAVARHLAATPAPAPPAPPPTPSGR